MKKLILSITIAICLPQMYLLITIRGQDNSRRQSGTIAVPDCRYFDLLYYTCSPQTSAQTMP